MPYHRSVRSFLMIFLLAFFILVSCADNDNDNHDSNDAGDDDDDDDNNDDDNDDDTAIDTPVYTTLDRTWEPVDDDTGRHLTVESGEPHLLRNDLNVVPTHASTDYTRFSVSYFLTLSDLHQADEESPTRLTFLKAWTVMFGMTESFYREQEDLAPHQLNAMVRTANRIQTFYDRDFDFAVVLGDGADNAQKNEFESLIDILDGAGLSSGAEKIARPDSGDLNIDPDSGLNLGERDFGAQETDAYGNNVNHFNRDGYPNSNADFDAPGLMRSDKTPVPWFYAIGNHDVLANGGFDPDGPLSCHSREDYIGDHSVLGYFSGIASAVDYMNLNPGQELHIGCGLFGQDINWQSINWLLKLGGDWTTDIDPNFDLMTLVNDTPANPADDGIWVTPDGDREFMGHRAMDLLNANGHGFADRNQDGTIDKDDGGWYRVDWDRIRTGSQIPLRLLVLDTMDQAISSEGGMSSQQLDWLSHQLDQAEADNVLVIVSTHHEQGGTILAGLLRFQRLLFDCPNVILHLNGHRHSNTITPHVSPDGDPLRSYWEVQTPSNIEFPQQARIFEIVDNRDGTGTIYTTLFDHQEMLGDAPDVLATRAREISVEEWEWGFSKRGDAKDRNAELLFAIPPGVDALLSQMESDGKVTSIDSLGTKF